MTHVFKIGMEVFIDRNRHGARRPMQLCTVEKVTATQFTAGGQRFRVTGEMGFQIGGYGLAGNVCRIATDERKRENDVVKNQRDAEAALIVIAEKLNRLADDDAIAAFAALPQSIKDMAKK